MNYTDALAQCQDDGAYIANQRSEDDFLIASLIPNQNTWIHLPDDNDDFVWSGQLRKSGLFDFTFFGARCSHFCGISF